MTPGPARARRRLAPAGRYLALAVLAGLFGFPLYWTVTMALKPPQEWVPVGRVVWFPSNPTLENFRTIFGIQDKDDFFSATFPSGVYAIENSLIASTAATLLALLVGIPTGYAIARYRAGRHLPYQLLLLRMFPPIVLVIPLFFVWAQLGLWDTLPGLILIYGAITFPFAVWLTRTAFLQLPRELHEAAIVDGATHWGAFLKVMLPAAKGAIAVTGLYVFILNWSDTVIALALTQTRAETATVYLVGLQADEVIAYGPKAALALILALPPLILGLAIRRHILTGSSYGAIRT